MSHKYNNIYTHIYVTFHFFLNTSFLPKNFIFPFLYKKALGKKTPSVTANLRPNLSLSKRLQICDHIATGLQPLNFCNQIATDSVHCIYTLLFSCGVGQSKGNPTLLPGFNIPHISVLQLANVKMQGSTRTPLVAACIYG